MKNERFSGLLLHPTSLPGPYGIGDFGSEAYRFTDFLAAASVKLWQVLPLGPTGYGNSPYSSRSTFAGNILLISLDLLAEDGLIDRKALQAYPDLSGARVDYQQVELLKMPLLHKAAENFLAAASGGAGGIGQIDAYAEFCRQNSFWLDDYALFAVATDIFQDSRWYSQWDTGVGFRDARALAAWGEEHAHDIEIRKVLQYFFYRQWQELKQYVNAAGIKLIGDIPIFVAADSSDAWVNRKLFKTDSNGTFSAQSGVPPDFFSETGQLWGTPIYDWEQKEKELLDWWILRIRKALEQTDIIRIDHFRGLEAYWEVPAGETTAINGTWKKAPGAKLFDRIKEEIGEVPIIAEDLGVMTPEVVELRDRYDLPGMKILQFAFEPAESSQGESLRLNAANDFLPHNYPVNCVVYTGTHDNDTTIGWYKKLPESYRDLVRRYLARPDHDISWFMIRKLMSSTARYAIFPVQDLLSLDTECRMNTPSTVGEANWSWRIMSEALDDALSLRFRELVELYGRD